MARAAQWVYDSIDLPLFVNLAPFVTSDACSLRLRGIKDQPWICLLYTSDAADEMD